MTSESVVIEIKKERKLDNPKYFVEYYANNNPHVVCECGQTIRRMFKPKHIKCAKHRFLLERKELEKDVIVDEIAV